MIAKSDLVILVLSASALAVGVYRWQQNTSALPIVTVPASARAVDTLPAGQDALPDATTSAATLTRVATGNAPPGGGDRPSLRRLDPAAPDADTAIRGTAAGTRVLGAPEPIVAATVTEVASERSPYGTYRVQSGDFLGRIAQRFDTSVATLRELNGIRGSTILVGQELRYPLPAD